MLRQYELQSDSHVMTCWLLINPKVRVGTRLSLKEFPDIIWTVTSMYSAHPVTDLMRGWNNNI